MTTIKAASIPCIINLSIKNYSPCLFVLEGNLENTMYIFMLYTCPLELLPKIDIKKYEPTNIPYSM